MVDKLERFAAPADRPRMKDLIRRELYHYTEVKHDCESVQEMLWKLINCISERKEIQAEKIKKLSPAAMGVLTACCAVAVGGVVAAPVTGGGSLGISVVALTPAVVATGLSIPVLILVAVVGLTLLSMLFKKYTKIKVSLYPPEVVCERKKHG